MSIYSERQGAAHPQTAPDPVRAVAEQAMPARPPRPRWRHIRPEHVGWTILALLLAALILPPIVQLQAVAVVVGSDVFTRLAEVPRIGATFRNTLLLAVGSTVIAVMLGTALAWWTSRLPPRAVKYLSLIPILPLAIPAVAFVTGWAFLLAPRTGYLNVLLRYLPLWSHLDSGPFDIYTVTGIVLVTAMNLMSFVFLYVYGALKAASGEYEAAAIVSGATPLRAFFTITLPIVRPAVVYSAAICLLLGLGQFTAPLLLGRRQGIDVITTEIFRLRENFPIDYALGAALGLPVLFAGFVVVFLQRKLIGDSRRFVVETGRASAAISYSSRWAILPTTLFAIVGIVLPIAALIYVAITPYWGAPANNFTLQHFRQVWFDDPRTVSAIVTSVVMSLLATVIVLPLGFFAALSMQRMSLLPHWLRNVIDVLVQLPLAVPSAIIGFGLLLAYSKPPLVLYGTSAVIILTYVTLMIPHAARSQLSSLMALGDTYIEAGRVMGGGHLRVLITIVLPLMRRGIATGTAIIIVLLFHEFTASLMVRSPRTQVMGTVLYDFWSQGSVSVVAVMALTMVLATLVGVIIALLIGGRNALTRS